jgi:outer membrane protein TolC
MRQILILIFLLTSFGSISFAQLTIEDCRRKARENYPLIKRYNLIEQAKEYDLSNANKGYLPKIQVNAKATYQSDVVKVSVPLPGVEIPSPTKDQYQAVIEANQVIWDGGIIHSQKKISRAYSEVETKQLEIDLFALDERVDGLFFGILLFDTQLEQNHILREELDRNYRTISGYIENGIASLPDLDAVKVEQLNAAQTRSQLQATREAYLNMLSIMTGIGMDGLTVLIKPRADELPSLQINRPELLLFDAQNQLFDSQKSLIKSSYMPRLGLFLQGGYGRPGLNLLSNTFDSFYIGGISLNWNFGSLYTQKNDLRKIEVNKSTVNTQRDVFLYNIKLAMASENQDIKRIRDLLKYDDEIVSLRKSIRQSAEAKVAGGTLTVPELMREISREDLARQAKAAHEIDLLIAIYNLKRTTNN